MDRVLSTHNPRFRLVYDVLQARRIGKATEAIRFCHKIRNPELAVNTALERLEKYLDDETVIVEAHINSVTKGEPVRWTIESLQPFINEQKDIKLLLCVGSREEIMNSSSVIKDIIARMPRRTRDELVKQLCKANQHLPNFEFLLKFVEKQLKLVLHPLMHIQ